MVVMDPRAVIAIVENSALMPTSVDILKVMVEGSRAAGRRFVIAGVNDYGCSLCVKPLLQKH